MTIMLIVGLIIGIPSMVLIEWKNITPKKYKKEFWSFSILMLVGIVLILIQGLRALPSVFDAIK